MSSGTLHVGVAELDITPETPVPLAGFASRDNAPSEGVDHPLALKAFWWSVGESHALLVVADILWWAPEAVDALKGRIAARWPVPPDQIVLHATHTHSAPHPSRVFTASLGLWDDSWIELLESRLLDAVGKAWDARQPATVSRGRGRSHIGIQRRVATGVEPDAEGNVDPEVVVLRIDDASGDPIAVLVHHACHPTTNELPRISSEFCGVMCEQVANDLPGATVAYLQGCCGDINPRTFLDRRKRKMDDGDVVPLGPELANDVRTILDGPLEPLVIDTISATRETAMLAVQRVPSPEELDAAKDEPGVTGEWARVLLADPARCAPELGIGITHLRLGSDLAFLAMAAEVTTPYGLAIKAATDQIALPLPYSNGMVGYVITEDQLAQGGYEPIESIPYFGLPSPFAPGIEASFSAAITNALTADERTSGHP